MSKSKEQCRHIIGENFDNIKNKNNLIEALEESIKEMCGSEFGFIYILNSNNTVQILNKNIDTIASFNDTIIETMLLSKKGFFDNYILSHKQYSQKINNPLNIKIKSILMVPILDKTKEKILGFLSASNSVTYIKEFARYEIRSLGLLDTYSRKIIEMTKSKKRIELKEVQLKTSNKINISKIKSRLELEQELQIELSKVKELEEKLMLKDELLSSLSMNEVVLAENILEKNKDQSLYELQYILDFLTNEVTYLANEEYQIYLFLEIIKNSLHNKEQLNFIERELSGSHLINTLAHKLYTREKMPLLFEEFNTFKVLSSISNLYYQSFVHEKIIFNIFIDPKLSVKMVSDIAKIKSLIIHLMNNVYGFISTGGVVNFSVFSSKENLTIEIKSFMPNEVKNIKDFFETKQITHSIVTKDKGLGLSVCSNLVNILGGKLKLTTEGISEHVFTAFIPIKIVHEKNKKEFSNKVPIKIAILMSEGDKYACQNLKRYFLSFNIPEINILFFKNYKKMNNINFSHLFCFESMLSDKFNMNYFSSITILKYRNETLIHSSLDKIKVNELTINAYYGMALQKIIFPDSVIENLEKGMIIIEDSFLKKFNNIVKKLKF